MSMLVCPVCRQEYPLGMDISTTPLRCPRCHVPLVTSFAPAIRETVSGGPIAEMEIAPCPSCRQPVSSLCPICPHCGAALDDRRYFRPLQKRTWWQNWRFVFMMIGTLAHVCCLGIIIQLSAWEGDRKLTELLLAAYLTFNVLFFGMGLLVELGDRPIRQRFSLRRAIVSTFEVTGIMAAIMGCAVTAVYILIFAVCGAMGY